MSRKLTRSGKNVVAASESSLYSCNPCPPKQLLPDKEVMYTDVKTGAVFWDAEANGFNPDFIEMVKKSMGFDETKQLCYVRYGSEKLRDKEYIYLKQGNTIKKAYVE